jgi:hypothetical protein
VGRETEWPITEFESFMRCLESTLEKVVTIYHTVSSALLMEYAMG